MAAVWTTLRSASVLNSWRVDRRRSRSRRGLPELLCRAQGLRQRLGVHDRERARRAGERGVEAADPAVRALAQDRRGLDDDDGVELEPLRDVQVEQVDAGAERRVDGIRPAAPQRLADVLQ